MAEPVHQLDNLSEELSDRAARALNRNAVRDALDKDTALREFTATTTATNTATTATAAMDEGSCRTARDVCKQDRQGDDRSTVSRR